MKLLSPRLCVRVCIRVGERESSVQSSILHREKMLIDCKRRERVLSGFYTGKPASWPLGSLSLPLSLSLSLFLPLCASFILDFTVVLLSVSILQEERERKFAHFIPDDEFLIRPGITISAFVTKKRGSVYVYRGVDVWASIFVIKKERRRARDRGVEYYCGT